MSIHHKRAAVVVFVSAACKASDGSSMQVAAGKVTTESSTEALNFYSIDAVQA